MVSYNTLKSSARVLSDNPGDIRSMMGGFKQGPSSFLVNQWEDIVRQITIHQSMVDSIMQNKALEGNIINTEMMVLSVLSYILAYVLRDYLEQYFATASLFYAVEIKDAAQIQKCLLYCNNYTNNKCSVGLTYVVDMSVRVLTESSYMRQNQGYLKSLTKIYNYDDFIRLQDDGVEISKHLRNIIKFKMWYLIFCYEFLSTIKETEKNKYRDSNKNIARSVEIFTQSLNKQVSRLNSYNLHL